MQKIRTLAVMGFVVLAGCSAPDANIDQLQERGGITYLVGKDDPFTGKAVEHGKLSGKLLKEIDYKDGKKHGRETKYFDNGQAAHEFYYVDGKMDGLQKYWNPNGELTSEERYKQGKLHGLSRYWWSGVIIKEGAFLDGNPDGTHTKWYDENKKEYEKIYDNGKFESEVSWDHSGNTTMELECKDGKVAKFVRYGAHGARDMMHLKDLDSHCRVRNKIDG